MKDDYEARRVRPIGKCEKCKQKNEIHGRNLCMKCYNQRRRKIKKYDWSMEHEHCIACKKKDFPHHAKGLCSKCRTKHDPIYAKNRILTEMRPERLKKKREYKKLPEVRERNRIRLIKRRKKHPEDAILLRISTKTNIKQLKKDLDTLEKVRVRLLTKLRESKNG